MTAEFTIRAVEYNGSLPSVIVELRNPDNKALAFLYPTGKIPNTAHNESKRVDSLLFALAQFEYLELSKNGQNPLAPSVEELFGRLKTRLYGCSEVIQAPDFIVDSFLKQEQSFLELGPKFSVPRY